MTGVENRMPYRANYRWQNHGQNVRSTVARYYEPRSAEEVRHIVLEARRNHQTVRVLGDGHSWSPLVHTDGYLIGTRRFNRILHVGTDPPRITVEPGVSIAATLRAYQQHGVCLPMNVDIPTLTIGGAISVGANGFSKEWGTYSDFVEEVELVTGTGELRTINRERDPRQWRAVACGLGVCGVLTKITLRLVPLFRVHVVTHRLGLEDAFERMPDVYANHEWVQYFWFPFNRTATLQTGDRTDAPLTWTRAKQSRKNAGGWMETVGTHVAHPLLLAAPRLTPRFDALAAGSVQAPPEVMWQTDNMLLGRWINSMVPSRNASVSFPSGPDDPWMGKAWRMVVDVVNEFAAQGRYPANLAMNIRLFGQSDMLLHAAPGAEGQPSCNIQITSFNNPYWEEFKRRLMGRWLQIPGVRPHWAKEYQDIPGVAEALQSGYGPHFEEFRHIREQEGFDPDGLFVNGFLRQLLFPIAPAGTQVAVTEATGRSQGE